MFIYVPFATAHPLRDSTLKLLVLVGKIRKAITVLSDLDSLNVNGLYVNDLPMHDFSRDLLFVGMYI